MPPPAEEGSRRRWSLPRVGFLPKRVAMGTRHSSRARPMGEERPVDEADGAPRLTEDDERVLEAIRRQLDSEFPAPSRKGRAARRRWDAAGAEEAEQNRRPWSRAARAWIVVGTLLLASTLGAIAGIITATRYLKSADPPAVADRERPRPSPEAVVSPSTAESPVPSFESPVPSFESPMASPAASRATKGSMAADVSPGKPRPSAAPIAPPAAVQAP